MKINNGFVLGFVALVLGTVSCTTSPKSAGSLVSDMSGGASITGATFDFAPGNPDGEWHSQARDYANTRYSTLKQINTGNVNRLRIAWTFSNGTQGGQEAAPLVVDNTMYVVTPFPDLLFALDLTKPGQPIKWKFTPNPSPIAKGKLAVIPSHAASPTLTAS